jgi:hypothetical protein
LREIGGFTKHRRAPSLRASCYAIAKPSTLGEKMQIIKRLRGHQNAVYCGLLNFLVLRLHILINLRKLMRRLDYESFFNGIKNIWAQVFLMHRQLLNIYTFMDMYIYTYSNSRFRFSGCTCVYVYPRTRTKMRTTEP